MKTIESPPKGIAAVCVYCGSGPGDDPDFSTAAHDLGEIFANEKIRGVFGGGSIGLMGAFSTSMISHGGRITGVIPKLLVEREQPIIPQHDSAVKDAYQLVVATDMYDRKRKFREFSDGFAVLPGGCGSLDEFFEELTGIQIGDHAKPMVVVNIKGFWDPLLVLLEHLRRRKFVRAELEFDKLFTVVNRVEDVLPNLRRLAGETNVVDIAEHRTAG